jgi:hypothetical protein
MDSRICRLTIQVFSALFVPFRGYSNLRFIFAPLRLCVRFSVPFAFGSPARLS